MCLGKLVESLGSFVHDCHVWRPVSLSFPSFDKILILGFTPPSGRLIATTMPLRAPPPSQSAARRAIKSAFKDLERTIAPTESRDFSSTTLDDVRKAAINIKRQLAARQSLRNTRQLEPLFKGLEHYAKVIEVLANGTNYLPWIWAPIKLILKIAADYIDAFERIIRAYSQIADSLRRFQALERSFQGTPELYPTFTVFYADILTFHKSAYKFVSRPYRSLPPPLFPN